MTRSRYLVIVAATADGFQKFIEKRQRLDLVLGIRRRSPHIYNQDRGARLSREIAKEPNMERSRPNKTLSPSSRLP